MCVSFHPAIPARAKKGWVAEGAGRGSRPGHGVGWCADAPASPRASRGPGPAPSRTILVGVASWVFTGKAARLSLVGVSLGYLCMCVCL